MRVKHLIIVYVIIIALTSCEQPTSDNDNNNVYFEVEDSDGVSVIINEDSNNEEQTTGEENQSFDTYFLPIPALGAYFLKEGYIYGIRDGITEKIIFTDSQNNTLLITDFFVINTRIYIVTLNKSFMQEYGSIREIPADSVPNKPESERVEYYDDRFYIRPSEYNGIAISEVCNIVSDTKKPRKSHIMINGYYLDNNVLWYSAKDGEDSLIPGIYTIEHGSGRFVKVSDYHRIWGM